MLRPGILSVGVFGRSQDLYSSLLPADTTNLIVGNSLTDVGIIITYDAVRGALYQTGTIEISSPYTDLVNNPPVVNFDFDDIGLTFTSDLSGNDIRLNCIVGAGVDVVFNYVIEVIKGTKAAHYYVDVFNGSNANDGSIDHPFATVAYADSVLSLNAPLKLKYPNEKWVVAPAYWHGLKALFPMMTDGITLTNCVDVANGIVGVLSGTLPTAFQSAGVAFNGTSSYVLFGKGVLGMGTEDETIIVNIRPTFNDDNPHVIFSNGAFGGEVGRGINQYQKKFGFQMRSASTLVAQLTNIQAIPGNYVYAASVKRNDVHGLKLYVNGILKNSPGDNTVSLGVQDLTSNARDTLIGAGPGVTYPIKADWIKEMRFYNTELSGADIVTATNEIIANENNLFPFQSGDYVAMGIGSSYGSSVVTLLQGFNQGGPFHKLPEVIYTGRPAQGFGNAKILPLVKDKCNNTIAPQVGEINWLMAHEIVSANPMYIAISYNGINWTYLTQLPASCNGMGDFFVDNDDPSDFHNIHLISFVPTPVGKVYETHPTSADFSTWSAAICIFTNGVAQIWNESIVLINGVYHMLFSNQDHYMHHAICTHDPFTLANDWTVIQTGDWSGLGIGESYSIFNIGGNSWILYYLYLGTVGVPSTYRYRYSISHDNLSTWSAGVDIPELSYPTMQFSVGFVKLK